MSLEAFIDIRFADPVLSLTLTPDALAYGTALGRILYFNFNTKEEVTISEFSEECIRGIHLTEASLYVAVGDLKGLVVQNIDNTDRTMNFIAHDKEHSAQSCNNTQVLMHQDCICLFSSGQKAQSLSSSATELFHLSYLSSDVKLLYDGLALMPNSIPFDFDGRRILWLEIHNSSERLLKLYNLSCSTCDLMKVFNKKYGIISQAKLLNDSIILVKNHRYVVILDISTGRDRHTLGQHKHDIIALDAVEIAPKERNAHETSLSQAKSEDMISMSVRRIVISLDVSGCICVWENGGLMETIRIEDLEELTPKYKKLQYFAMGYPYVLKTCMNRIAFSSDLGVLVIKSRHLTTLVV
jgi:hypothetical protein